MTEEQKEEIRKLLREEVMVRVFLHHDDSGCRIEVALSIDEEKITSDWAYLPIR